MSMSMSFHDVKDIQIKNHTQGEGTPNFCHVFHIRIVMDYMGNKEYVDITMFNDTPMNIRKVKTITF